MLPDAVSSVLRRKSSDRHVLSSALMHLCTTLSG